MSLFEELKEASKCRCEEVTVPEWESVLKGRKLYIWQMDSPERDEWEAEGMSKDGDGYKQNLNNVRARLVCRCLKDEEGNRVFPNAEAMRGVVHTIIGPLHSKAWALNGFGADDVEDAAKN